MNTLPCLRVADRSMSSLLRIVSSLILITLALAISRPAAAQTTTAQASNSNPTSTGSVAGRVLDTSTGKYLEGAEITIQHPGARTASGVTQRGGYFQITGVPAGSQTLTITYPGLDQKNVSVEVPASGSVDAGTISLGGETIMLQALKVTSSKEGMAEAQALQKISVQYKLVAANDQFGPVMEGNVGEYLKFLPGVNIDYNVNDARGVSLRGLSTAFTIVAVDGTPMAGASSTDDTRRFEFEQIAMNNVATSEIYKTVTPDIPASATGGFVNFVTKSAFDHSEVSLFNYDLSLSAPSTRIALSKQSGVWGQGNEFVIRPSLELNYARQLGKKFGFNVNYRLSEKYDSSPRTEYTWNTTKVGNLPNSIFSGAPLLQQYNIRDEEKLTHRESFATKLDYNISDSTKLVLGGQWNWYDLHFTQRGPQFNLGTGAGATRTGDTFTGGVGSQIQNGTLQRRKYGTTWDFNATLSHEFANKSKLSITPYWSRADSKYRDINEGYISSVAVMSASTNPNTPANTYAKFNVDDVLELGTLADISLYDATGASIPLDRMRQLSNYTLSNTTGTNFQSRQWTAVDIKAGVNGYYKIPLDLAIPVTLQVGGAFDDTKRTIDRPDFRGNIPATTGPAIAALADTGYTNDVAFGFGPMEVLSPSLVWQAFPNNLTLLSAEDTRDIHEKNDSGYLRADITPIKNLLFVAGVRYEKHTIDATAKTGSPSRARTTTADLDYDSWYPSITFKYTPTKKIVFRGGYARTIGHPDYGEILPTFIVPSTTNGSDGTITVPDGNLKPYFVNNYDLSFDYYIKNTGLVGVSVFLKDISDYIITRGMSTAQRDEILEQYGFNPADFGTTSGNIRTNGSESRIQGLELYYQQNLTFLPKPFDGLNIQANFTVLDIDAKDSDPYRALDTEYSQSRAVAPKTINFIVGYRYNKLNALVTMNWKDESLYGGFVNTNYVTGSANTANPALDTRVAFYKDEKLTTDFKLEYAFTKQFSAYFVVRNVFNEPNREFIRGYLPQNQGTVLPYRYFEFGEPHLTLGFRGTF